ncbi:MAG: thioesterase family protein [Alphaproteobacteria bacterium]|nr:thioesterase family protein [Alphaproteobacteria bacterium]
MSAPEIIDGPLALHAEPVRPDWIDYNGHMNVAFYVLAFDHATDAFFDFIGLDEAYRETQNASTFAVESHVCYLRELHEGDPMRFTTQLLGFDAKRLHYFHRMYHAEGGYLAATLESLSLHVDMATRRVAPMPDAIFDRLARIHEAHAGLPRPSEAGQTIRMPTSR